MRRSRVSTPVRCLLVVLVLCFTLVSAGDALAGKVARVATTTTVSASAPAVVGSPVTITATVTATDSAVAPSGIVSFTAKIGRSKVTLPASCASATVIGGSAACTFTPTSTGTYAFTAQFSPGTKTFASSSGTVSVVVVPPLTSSTVAVSVPTSASVGSPVNVTAAVGPTGATGTVDFTATQGGNHPVMLPSTCTGVTVAAGLATCTFTPTAAGSYVFTAGYSGSATYAPSTGDGSLAVSQGVASVGISDDLAANHNVGDLITFTATVTLPGGATPTGAVTWTLGGGDGGFAVPLSCTDTTALSAAGTATCSVQTSASGFTSCINSGGCEDIFYPNPFSATATFTGSDPNYTGAAATDNSSDLGDVSVNAPPGITIITSAPFLLTPSVVNPSNEAITYYVDCENSSYGTACSSSPGSESVLSPSFGYSMPLIASGDVVNFFLVPGDDYTGAVWACPAGDDPLASFRCSPGLTSFGVEFQSSNTF